MCRIENAHSPERASIMEVAAWIATAVFAVMMILMLASGCMTIRDCVIKVDNKSGTVSIGNKDVQVPVHVPVTTTIPSSEVMQ